MCKSVIGCIVIIIYLKRGADIVVFMPTIVVNIFYTIATIFRRNMKSFDKMPTRNTVVVRGSIENKPVGEIVNIEETASYGFVVRPYEFAMEVYHTNAQIAFYGEYELW